MKLQVVVPVKNEEHNVASLVRQIHDAFANSEHSYDLVFVVDKSTDSTLISLQKLSEEYPITVLEKTGRPGKGYSLLEGLSHTDSDYVAFIDGDLQYPPSVLPSMLQQIVNSDAGVVVANRKAYKAGLMRRFGSRANALVFGKVLLGLNCDIQSGLKVFKREIFPHINFDHVTAWTFDIPLLHAAKELGYKIENYNIDFEDRRSGASHVSFFKTALAIAKCAVLTKFTERRIYNLESGIVYRNKSYVTHTNLPHHKSAIYTLVRPQKVGLFLLFLICSVGFYLNAMTTATILTALLSFVYFLDVLFNLFVVLKSLHFPPEIFTSNDDLKKLEDESLPVYTILCPLYKEWEVLPHFVENVDRLDWPKEKLEVLLLLEENDAKTIEVAREMQLPHYFKLIIVPHSMPKTKPKACNYGLQVASGEYVVIYDAEDKPEPDQLKKAFLAFSQSHEKVFCIQAKLNYFNPHHNLLTRLFTAEYSLWFDVVLPGLQSISTSIPLGGTSNHFKTASLRRLHGWDPFNVTEDCDLGVRLFKEGYTTAIVDSVTYEEANSDVINWIRQRSRWIKGYMQTYFVHMRNPWEFVKKNGWHALVFQLVIGLRIYFMLINPVLWVATFSYFALYRYVGPTIEALYPTLVFYMAAFSLIFGNFTYLYTYMIGCAKRGHWTLMKYVFLIPLYWLIMSIAAVMAFYQLIFKPHHWEKTNHGLHLKKKKSPVSLIKYLVFKKKLGFKFPEFKLPSLPFTDGTVLIISGLFANILNYAYNAFLTRTISVEEFGVVSLIGSFLFLSTIPLNALGRTISHKSAFYLGKYGSTIGTFWKSTRQNISMYAIGAAVVFVCLSPFLQSFFQTKDWWPFIIFAPALFIGSLAAVDAGYLTGNQKFKVIGLIMVSEAILKLILASALVSFGYQEYVYLALTVSMLSPLLIGYFYASKLTKNPVDVSTEELKEFPNKFFSSSLLLNFSVITYLSFDVLFAKHFLSPSEAGMYAILAIVGKMIYFVGNLFSQFIVPIVSKEDGHNVKDSKSFLTIMGLTAVSSFAAYLVIGYFGWFTGPLLLGSKALDIVAYLPYYGLGIFFYTLGVSIFGYHQVKEKHIYPVVGFVISIVQVVAMYLYHANLANFVYSVTIVGILTFFIAITLHLYEAYTDTIINNLRAFTDLFSAYPNGRKMNPDSLNILVLNWYDTKHTWGGGAEVYIHNLAKNFIKEGHSVTLFCGNDTHSPRYEVIDGVSIVRRGGLYTVAIWAFIYYVFKFHGKYDVIIDSAKGVPFFAPLYSRRPVFGLICHVHQEMFRTGLGFPLREISLFLEGILLPVVYRNVKMFTISQSSKTAMLDLGLGKKHTIDIAVPGVELKKPRVSKFTYPTAIYLGRLRDYKCIDVFIKASAKLKDKISDLKIIIAGSGESEADLKRLVKNLQLDQTVEFVGRVSEEDKAMLLTKSWVAVQPSMVEGWGITNIEANLCGTPVIAANVEGLRDSVVHGETGLLVEPQNVESLANALEMMLTSANSRKNLGTSGSTWAKKYTWDATARVFLDCMKNHLNENYSNRVISRPFVEMA